VTLPLDSRSFRQALGRFPSGGTVVAEVADAVDGPLLYYRSHYGALLHSAASEKSMVALRDSIVEDSGNTRADPPSGERTTSA
jgi:hypothetical protein